MGKKRQWVMGVWVYPGREDPRLQTPDSRLQIPNKCFIGDEAYARASSRKSKSKSSRNSSRFRSRSSKSSHRSLHSRIAIASKSPICKIIPDRSPETHSREVRSSCRAQWQRDRKTKYSMLDHSIKTMCGSRELQDCLMSL
ncbi:hypothetical protein IQ07DRAFT_26224 [Pyrenochaeta sp. DS3sAY3a]|nr:hypothetical protein IQ07DRAFT_26224 [Pyrenochaeta sp. DS3sAY3a]